VGVLDSKGARLQEERRQVLPHRQKERTRKKKGNAFSHEKEGKGSPIPARRKESGGPEKNNHSVAPGKKGTIARKIKTDPFSKRGRRKGRKRGGSRSY